MQIAINRQTIEIGSRGAVVALDLSKLNPQVLEQLFIYGAIQKIADSASTAGTDAAKLALGEDAPLAARKEWLATPIGEAKARERALGMMEKAIAALYAGEWSMREGGGTVVKFTDAEALAIETAKGDLTARFRKACEVKGVRPKMENYALLGEAAAKYFHEKAKKLCWNDAEVMRYIAAQAESGKAQYIADAQAELDRRAAALGEVDITDLLADL